MACGCEGRERGGAFLFFFGVVCRKLRKELLLVFIICGVLIGFIVGASVNGPINAITDPEVKASAIVLVGFPGELFLNMLKMLVLPLIVASFITALSTLDSKATGKIGRRTVLFHLGTMLIAVIIGVTFVMTIRPGERSRPERTGDEKQLKPRRNMDSFLDLLSAATLPTTIKCVEENNDIDSRISRFVLPLGATVNMDGTALYQGVCTIWIAQINGIPLGPGQVVTTVLTAMAAARGTAAIPSGGLVTLLIVPQAVYLPTADVGLLWAVDWFVDRFRGLINVLGDAIGAGVVVHLSRDDLALADLKTMEEGRGMETNKLLQETDPLNQSINSNRESIESTL